MIGVQKCPICERRLCDVIGGAGNITTSMVCPQCTKIVEVELVASNEKKVNEREKRNS